MINNPMDLSADNNMAQKSCERENGNPQTQSTNQYQVVNPTNVDIQMENILISAKQEAEYPKVPQTRHSELLMCTQCGQVVKSDVSFGLGRGSYIVIIILIAGLITAFFAILPFIVKGCQDAKHKCPKCQNLLGTKQFLIG